MADARIYNGFIAVHAGAGYHSVELESKYKSLCKLACEKASQGLKNGLNAVDAAVLAVKVLEDSPITNAGTGSNLTMDGKVECDASVMDGSTLHWGAVGALPAIRNPVDVARMLLKGQQGKQMSLGRIPPCLLVGSGAQEYAHENGFEQCRDSELITASSHKSYKRALKKLNKSTDNQRSSSLNVQEEVHSISPSKLTDTSQLLDTVGCVCIDCDGNMASAVSSGGIVLKHSGRVGQAAAYGAGCWAENVSDTHPGIAVTTSGCGEHIIKTSLAKTCGYAMQTADSASLGLSKTFKDNFLTSRFLHDVDKKLAGVLAIRFEQDGEAELVWAHSTETMCIGYMSYQDKHAKAKISRMPSQKAGKTIYMQGLMYKLFNSQEPCEKTIKTTAR